MAERPAGPAAVVVFGASGDLLSRKLAPALATLAGHGLLADGTALVGVARSDLGDDGFRRRLTEAGGDGLRWRELVGRARYVTGAYGDPATYGRLAEVLRDADEHGAGGNRLYYLSTPPDVFLEVVHGLGGCGGHRPAGDGGFARVVVEKPFGRDLASAQRLDRELHGVLDEDQVYRIDHYLGKETVQNVLALRFANSVFEPLWNRRYVDHVQITVAETDGVGHRAGFYEDAGALRDIVQNHLLQVMALAAMEPPARMSAKGIRDEKVKLLSAVEELDPGRVADHVVRGQYGAGVIDGEEVPGYLDEPGVDAGSTTETFVAMRLLVDNWRWAGVPFFLRTGKRLPRRATEVVLRFRPVPHLPFAPTQARALGPNALVLRIQPHEGIALCFGAKIPGQSFDLRSVTMDFSYAETFEEESPEAYERLLLDALQGDATLFIRSDEVEHAWRVVQPLLDDWADDDRHPHRYAAGTWGPPAADRLIHGDGRAWREPTA